MTGWQYVLAGAAFAMVIAGVVGVIAGRFCALTSPPSERHPSMRDRERSDR